MNATKRDHLGTFRIAKEKWEKFQALAESEGLSASLAICNLIDSTLSGAISLAIPEEPLDKWEELEQRVKRLEDKLNAE